MMNEAGRPIPSERAAARRATRAVRLRRISLSAGIAALLALFPTPTIASELGCGRDHWDWKTATFAGEAHAGRETAVAAGRYVVVLEPIATGWRIRLREPEGGNLPLFSPPQRPVRFDPLSIVGTRVLPADPESAAESPPPIRIQFTFGRLATDPLANPEIVAPGAAPIAPDVMPVEGDAGRGEVVVDEAKLGDAAEGAVRPLEFIRFRGCLEWNSGYRETLLAQTAPQRMNVGWLLAAMDTCGVDARTYRISERMAGPPASGRLGWLEPDLDGDTLRDFVVPMERIADGAPGLAICLRRDKRLLLAGFGQPVGDALPAGYFAAADWWAVHAKGPVGQGVTDEAPPELHGDAVVLGIEGASSVLLFLDAAGQLASYPQGD